MSPRVIAIIVAIVLVIVVGMVLTVKRSAGKHPAQKVWNTHEQAPAQSRSSKV